MASEDTSKMAAIDSLLRTLHSTVPSRLRDDARQEYNNLIECKEKLRTKYKQQYNVVYCSDSKIKQLSDMDELTRSQKEPATNIIEIIRLAENMNIDGLSASRIELVGLINAKYFLNDIEQRSKLKPLKELLSRDRIKGVSRQIIEQANKEYSFLLKSRDVAEDFDPGDPYSSDDHYTVNDIKRDQQEAASGIFTVINCAQDIDETMRRRAIKEFIRLTSIFTQNVPPRQFLQRSKSVDDTHSSQHNLSISEHSDVYTERPESHGYFRPQPSNPTRCLLSPNSSPSSPKHSRMSRSLSDKTGKIPEKRPFKELVFSLRGKLPEEVIGNALREHESLVSTQKNLSQKFPKEYKNLEVSRVPLEDIPLDKSSSFYHMMKVMKDTSPDNEMYEDAVEELSMLVESEQRYCLAKSTHFQKSFHIPDTRGNVSVPRKEYDDLQKELTRKTKEVDELTTRLSRMASQQMTEGNPNIADLSDRYRPTKIGEMYGLLYDEEWSEAFEVLRTKSAVQDDDDDDLQIDVLTQLSDLVKEAFDFTSIESEGQLQKLQDSILAANRIYDRAQDSGEVNMACMRCAKEVRRKIASFSSKSAAEKFKECKIKSLLTQYNNDRRLHDYINKCIELTWYMVIQDPPMSIKSLPKGQSMNTTEFCYHGRKGKTVEICVWPALFLYKGGPLVSKGHVLPSK